ncbi:MAG: type II toxin-antitoxin system HicB family antitoxin [Acidobacteriales bacterium]|nr:type II toxin-antitoxin system HicB family antitoxin [Terriglobales bacterium]
MLRYPVKLTWEDSGAVVISFPDVPEAHTFGGNETEALSRAVDALETALSMYIGDRQPIPTPSPKKRGWRTVSLPALTEAKIALYLAMRASHVGKAELARRLKWHLPQVDRLLDLMHASRMNQIEQAFAALGKRVSIVVEDAA